jgi:hypothetical protein
MAYALVDVESYAVRGRTPDRATLSAAAAEASGSADSKP